MNTDKLFFGILFLVIGIALGFLFAPRANVPQGGGSIRESGGAFGVATSTNITVNTTTTQIFALNAERSYASIINGTSNNVWCEADTGATTTQGWLLSPVTSSTGKNYIEFGPNHIPYYGAVHCIADGAAAVVNIVENQ